MAERIVILTVCILCAFPFWVIAAYNKNSMEPIVFWSGDRSLCAKVRNVQAYNREMAVLYQKCALAFLLAGAAGVLLPFAAIVMVVLYITVGIYLVYRSYKKILERYC